VVPRVAALSERVRAYLADGRRGEMLRDGLQVAIVGRPNAGKSSLLNLLARRDVAIVSDVPGTTRDVLEVPLNLGGLPVVLADTAGLRDSADPVEREGIARARQRRDAADVVVAVCDAAAPDAIDSVAELAGAATGSSLVVVFNKLDALRAALPEALRARPRADLERELVARLRAPPLAACLLSCRSGEGVPELVATLQRVAEQR
jgi:tRNA modification GTPase